MAMASLAFRQPLGLGRRLKGRWRRCGQLMRDPLKYSRPWRLLRDCRGATTRCTPPQAPTCERQVKPEPAVSVRGELSCRFPVCCALG